MEISCKTCIHKKVCDLWREVECQSAKSFFDDECELYAAEPKKGRWIGERKMNMTDIKTDAHSINLLCNSLNAHYIAAAHRGDEILSILLFQAQGTITKLYEENCALKKAEEEE